MSERHPNAHGRSLSATGKALWVTGPTLGTPGSLGRWVPLCGIHDDSEVYAEGHHGTLIVKSWLAAQWAQAEVGRSRVDTSCMRPRPGSDRAQLEAAQRDLAAVRERLDESRRVARLIRARTGLTIDDLAETLGCLAAEWAALEGR